MYCYIAILHAPFRLHSALNLFISEPERKYFCQKISDVSVTESEKTLKFPAVNINILIVIWKDNKRVTTTDSIINYRLPPWYQTAPITLH